MRKGVRRIAQEQLGKAIAEIDDSLLDRHQVIHQVRKRCKKLRGLIRLVRPALGKTYARENQAFRDAAGVLSELRDAHVQIEVYDQLMDQYASAVQRDACHTVRQQLALRRDQIDRQEIDRCLAEVRQRLADAQSRASKWKLSCSGFDALAGGIAKTHARARLSLQVVIQDPSTAALHDWRKRVKYHGYHAMLLKGICPELLKPYVQVLDGLGETLGDDHNLAVLRESIQAIAKQPDHQADIQSIAKVLEHRRQQLQKAAIPLGQRLFAESTKSLVTRLNKYWKL